MKLQDADLDTLRSKLSDREDELDERYSKLEVKHTELQTKMEQMQNLAITLQVQLAEAQSDATDLRAERERLIHERNDEKQALQDALDAAIIERAENDAKWQRDFEQLRTVNSGRSSEYNGNAQYWSIRIFIDPHFGYLFVLDREELLLQDCEWQIRSTQQSCKARVVEAEKLKKDAIEKAEKIEAEARTQFEKVNIWW